MSFSLFLDVVSNYYFRYFFAWLRSQEFILPQNLCKLDLLSESGSVVRIHASQAWGPGSIPGFRIFCAIFFILYFQVKVFQRRSMFTLNQDIWMSNPLIAYFNRHTRSGALRQTRKENAKGNKFGNNHR